MLNREYGQMTLVCDECMDPLDESYPSSEFQAMIEDAKKEGWSIRPDDQGGWWHTCPDCSVESETPLEKARRLFG